MFIHHITLYVNDLEMAKDFFIKYFGAEAGKWYNNLETGFKSYFLYFKEGACLEIMNRPDMEDIDKPLFKTGYILVWEVKKK